MTNEIIEFYREHLKPIIQKMLLETNYQGQGKIDYEEFGRDFDELLDLAIIGMQSNSDEDCISRQAVLDMVEDMTDQFGNKHRVVTEGMISLLPPVTPKPKTEVLDKIRAEIKALTDGAEPEHIWNVDVLEIIDKYKAESEE